MASYEELIGAARKAHEAGNAAHAKRFLELAKSQKTSEISHIVPKRERSLKDALVDNVVGRDDGVMSVGEKLGAALNLGGEGLTFGLVGDEAAAAADALVGRGSYDERLAKYRQDEQQFFDENPVLATASQVVPALAIPTGAALSGGGLLARIAKSSAAGGVGAGLFGFMEGEGGLQSRRDRASDAATVGGLLGAAVPVAGSAVGALTNRARGSRAIKQAAASAPTKRQLEAQASRLFEQNKTAQLPRDQFRAAASDLVAKATDAGMDNVLTPAASRVAQNVERAAVANTPKMTMQELSVLRRQAAIPAGNIANRTEAAIGTRMIAAIDDHVDNVAPQLGKQGKEAREMWSRLRKMDKIDEIFERAELSASGFQNGLMNEFRKILRSDKLKRGFTKAELAAMKQVTNPGVLQGLIRQVGRLGFSLDNGSNALGGGLGAILGGTAGSAAGSPLVGAVAVPAIGTASRKLSEQLTSKAANRVADVVRAPGVQLPVISNQSRGLLEEALLRGARSFGSQSGRILPQ